MTATLQNASGGGYQLNGFNVKNHQPIVKKYVSIASAINGLMNQKNSGFDISANVASNVANTVLYVHGSAYYVWDIGGDAGSFEGAIRAFMNTLKSKKKLVKSRIASGEFEIFS